MIVGLVPDGPIEGFSLKIASNLIDFFLDELTKQIILEALAVQGGA